MIEKLKIKFVYDDFIRSIELTDEQIKILNLYIKRETRYKISTVVGLSERSVGNEIIKIKKLYKNYCELQQTKATILKD